MTALDELKQFHAETLAPTYGPPVGATDAEIAELERTLGARLPADYRGLLRFMGNDLDGWLRGSECFVRDVPDATEWLPDLFDENGLGEPPRRFVCVCSHQGYAAVWFKLPASEPDPRAYSFCEGVDRSVRCDGTIVEWFLKTARDVAAIQATR